MISFIFSVLLFIGPEQKSLATQELSIENEIKEYTRLYDFAQNNQLGTLFVLTKERQIVKTIFSDVTSQNYIKSLKLIESEYQKHPSAILNLSSALQRHYENTYTIELINQRRKTIQRSETWGTIAGFAALGASLFKTPKDAPLYFRTFVYFFPVIGKETGNLVGESLAYREGFSEIPPAPAQIINLGFSNLSDSEVPHQVEKWFLSLGQTAGSWVVFTATELAVARGSAWMGRIGPVARLSGWLIAIYATWKFMEFSDRYRENYLTEINEESLYYEYEQAKKALYQDLKSSSQTQILISANRLSEKSILLSNHWVKKLASNPESKPRQILQSANQVLIESAKILRNSKQDLVIAFAEDLENIATRNTFIVEYHYDQTRLAESP